MKKHAITFYALLLILAIFMTSIPAFASEASIEASEKISPRLSHLANSKSIFSATSNGGYATVTYDGYSSFVRADVTIKVQKRFLLVFWTDVGEWSSTSTDKNGMFVHTFTLDGSGTYRASFTLVITGNDGTVDTITDTIESKY